MHNVSIHAPNEGSDAAKETVMARCFEFQSTLPMKGATTRSHRQIAFCIVSIHAPNEGSDVAGNYIIRALRVSIHAPNEGSDFPAALILYRRLMFQSTLPMKGATVSDAATTAAGRFQSTLPMK